MRGPVVSLAVLVVEVNLSVRRDSTTAPVHRVWFLPRALTIRCIPEGFPSSVAGFLLALPVPVGLGLGFLWFAQ